MPMFFFVLLMARKSGAGRSDGGEFTQEDSLVIDERRQITVTNGSF